MSVYAQERGPLTDVWPLNADGKRIGPATVFCEHGLTWREGDLGCLPCLAGWRSLPSEERPDYADLPEAASG